MLTILFSGIAFSLLLYYLIWYWGHRGHRQIARGIQTLNALEAVQASYRAGDYQTGLQQSEALKRGPPKRPSTASSAAPCCTNWEGSSRPKPPCVKD
jgi:hypothetical protein